MKSIDEFVGMFKIEDIINKIHCADCLNFMKEMPDKCVDLVITSPPYNLSHGICHGKHHAKYSNFSLEKPELDYYVWTKKIWNELLRICKTYIFYIIQLVSGNKKILFDLFGDYSGNIKELIIWNKTNPQPSMEPGVLNSGFEFIIILSDEHPEKRKFNNANFHGNLNNVITGSGMINNPYAKWHRAVFPTYLIEILIKNFTQEGDIILDPMIGTGTVGESCQLSGRNFIGIEINPDYCKIAEERLAQGVL